MAGTRRAFSHAPHAAPKNDMIDIPGRSISEDAFTKTTHSISNQTTQKAIHLDHSVTKENGSDKRSTEKDFVTATEAPTFVIGLWYPKKVALATRSKLRSDLVKPLDGKLPYPAPRGATVSAQSLATSSECDIELEDLPVARSYSTYSTERLIRPSSASSISLGEGTYHPRGNWLNTNHERGVKDPQASTDATPNYKPAVIRWPYCVFLLMILAGLFGFLEFEMNNLPPAHYKLLPIHSSIRVPNRTDEPGGHRWNVHELQRVGNSVLLDGRGTATALARRTASPEPVPEPRPPEDNYPKPFTSLNTFCGWAAPTWRVNMLADDPPALTALPSSGGKPETSWMINTTIMVEEIIDTFTTDNPSWCPCRLGDLLSDLGPGSIDWAMNWPGIPPNPDWYLNAPYYQSSSALLTWDSHDQGCWSAMYAISTFRYCKRFQFETSLVTSQLGSASTVDVGVLGLSSTQLTTPPAELKPQPEWQYARIDGKGNAAIPLVRRIAGSDLVDVFGNFVRSTDTALYPELDRRHGSVLSRFGLDLVRRQMHSMALDQQVHIFICLYSHH
ncbi:hypothetical protein V8F06_013564 [Rhypophila decipiens]